MLSDLKNVNFESYMRFNFRCTSVYEQTQSFMWAYYIIWNILVCQTY